MRKNLFEQSVDMIKPDAYMKTRLAAKVSANQKTSRRRPAAILAGALCLVLMISLFTVSAFSGKIALPLKPHTGSEVTSQMPGGIMVAYADENGETQEKPLEGDGFICGRVYYVDISGMSEEEIQQAYDRGVALTGRPYLLPVSLKEEEYDEFHSYGVQDIIEKGDHVLFASDSIYRLEDEGNPLRLDVDADTVESITVSCDSEYIEPEFNNAGALRFNDNLEFDESKSDVNPFLTGNFTVSGDDYRKDKAVGKACGLPNMCDFHWQFKEGFTEMLGADPNFNLADADSDITFTVKYTNGETSKSVIRISFEQDGEMFNIRLAPVSYNYQ